MGATGQVPKSPNTRPSYKRPRRPVMINWQISCKGYSGKDSLECGNTGHETHFFFGRVLFWSYSVKSNWADLEAFLHFKFGSEASVVRQSHSDGTSGKLKGTVRYSSVLKADIASPANTINLHKQRELLYLEPTVLDFKNDLGLIGITGSRLVLPLGPTLCPTLGFRIRH